MNSLQLLVTHLQPKISLCDFSELRFEYDDPTQSLVCIYLISPTEVLAHTAAIIQSLGSNQNCVAHVHDQIAAMADSGRITHVLRNAAQVPVEYQRYVTDIDIIASNQKCLFLRLDARSLLMKFLHR